jgi:hypothetical protein
LREPGVRTSVNSTHIVENGEAAMEAAMPLIYVPLILYAGWMEFLVQPLRAHVEASERDMRPAPAPRTIPQD